MTVLTLDKVSEQKQEGKNEMERAVRKYQRLVDRSKELNATGKEIFEKRLELMMKGEDLSKEEDTQYHLIMMEEDCIAHFFGAGGIEHYGAIASFCKENGVEKVIDIGCAYGHQSECFLEEGIDYVGVNTHDSQFWNADQFQYITAHYPCELPAQKGDLAVSVLALTWNCYLYDKEKTLRQQCEALQRDFEHCLLYLTEEGKNALSKYFRVVQKIDRNLYYFSNKGEL